MSVITLKEHMMLEEMGFTKEDLKEYKLEENFASVDELYLETRKESIQHAVSAHCRYF